MELEIRRPLPRISPVNRHFWEMAADGLLGLPWCEKCEATHFPPSPRCPHCLHDVFEWRAASGRAKLVSWVIFHRAYWDGVALEVPYNVCQVELEEGPRFISNLVGEAAREPRYQMPLQVCFTDAYPDLVLPVFDVPANACPSHHSQ